MVLLSSIWWYYMVFYDTMWYSMVLHGIHAVISWYYAIFSGITYAKGHYTWYSMVLYVIQCVLHGSTLYSIVHGIQWYYNLYMLPVTALVLSETNIQVPLMVLHGTPWYIPNGVIQSCIIIVHILLTLPFLC